MGVAGAEGWRPEKRKIKMHFYRFFPARFLIDGQ
jgi:hypothetical protein